MKGFLKETIKFEDLLASSAPFTFVNDPFTFLKVIDFFEGEYFLLFARWWYPSELGPQLHQGHCEQRRVFSFWNLKEQEDVPF